MGYDVRSLEQLEEAGKTLILSDGATTGDGTTPQRIAFALNAAAKEGWTVVGVNDAYVFLSKREPGQSGIIV